MASNKRHKWSILLRHGSLKKDIVITGNQGERSVDVHKRAKAIAQQLIERMPEGSSYEMFSRTQAFKPKAGTRPGKGQLWCPQCAKFRPFLSDEYLGVRKCFICGMSDQDFYVKKYNHVWRIEQASDSLSRKGEEQLRRRLLS